MTQLEIELQQLKDEVKNMWGMVRGQLLKALSSLLNFDRDLAREVVVMEKRINATELKIDRDCENIFALYSPVAIDLRFSGSARGVVFGFYCGCDRCAVRDWC